ncbi:MAG: ferric reductase-like transmembrane domain-containing protein [Pseudomonadota bacterium]
MKFLSSKPLVWVLLAAPFALICLRFADDTITYGQVLHQTGLWSAGLLIAALAITPLRRVFGSSRWLMAIMKHRRALGVASFAYAALHTGVYIERKWGADLIVKEGLEAPLATGWLAFAIFIVLAATSNDTSVRKMGRTWKRLHRWVYAATALMFAHWWLATFDPAMAYVFGAVLLLVQAPRLINRGP